MAFESARDIDLLQDAGRGYTDTKRNRVRMDNKSDVKKGKSPSKNPPGLALIFEIIAKYQPG